MFIKAKINSMNLNKIFVICILYFTLVSWGSSGHSIISRKSAASFPASMGNFHLWADSLSMHASDADTRKYVDANESPRHFIDIDNYAEYISQGRIPSTYDSVVAIHGASFVIANGTLPWTTNNTYDSLKQAFSNRQWHKAMLLASDLGHYVADGHMPLHLTPNYDGQLTGQKGVHSRFESTMVNNNQSTLNVYTNEPAAAISNVNKYIFDYIYYNHKYVDSILIADKMAKTAAGNTTSTVYYQSLWNNSKFTTALFKNASKALADLIFSAWVQAGSPIYGSLANSLEVQAANDVKVYPNPFSEIIRITAKDFLFASVYSINGELQGVYFSEEINLGECRDGVYLINIYGKNGLIYTHKLLKKN